MPPNLIPLESSPSMLNMFLKEGQIRTRPSCYTLMQGAPDKSVGSVIDTFLDSNNTVHTVLVTNSGLYQLGARWFKNSPLTRSPWNKIGSYINSGGLSLAATQIFTNKFYWSTANNYLWVWDGILDENQLGSWVANQQVYVGYQIQDSNGNWQIVTQAGITGNSAPSWSSTVGGITSDGTGSTVVQWTENGKPFVGIGGIQSVAIVNATLGTTAGAFFLGEIGAHLVMLNTIEGIGQNTQAFTQRIRWTPSGIPNIWDPNVNIGAGYNDFLEVPDAVTGILFIGNTGLIIRSNGVTEISLNTSSGENPFVFNHLWASERGIGNIYPFSVAQYGPVGIFIALDDIYEYSVGGFVDIGKGAQTAIFNDLTNATGYPLATMIPTYQSNLIYLQYWLMIPQGNNTKIWRYSVKDKSWQPDMYSNKLFYAKPNYVAIG